MSEAQDRINESKRLDAQLQALSSVPAWHALRDQLVRHHVLEMDALVKQASTLSESEIRDRLGYLRAYAEIATSPEVLRLRIQHLQKGFKARSETAQEEAKLQFASYTEGDEIDQQIAEHQAAIAAYDREHRHQVHGETNGG